MLRHLYTLEKLSESFRNMIGMTVVEAYSQQKDTAVIEFTDGDKSRFLQFSADPAAASVFSLPQAFRQRHNSADVLSDLIEETLKSVKLVKGDRIIRFSFINTEMYAVLFGGAASNLILTTLEGRIIDMLNDDPGLQDQFEIPQKTDKPLSEIDRDFKIAKALNFSEFHTGKIYGEEIGNRSKLDINRKISSLSDTEFNQLEKAARDLREECRKADTATIYADKIGNPFLSLAKLTNWEIREDSLPISEACRKIFAFRMKIKDFLPEKNDLEKKISRIRGKIQRRMAAASDDSKSVQRAEKYRNNANILMARPDLKSSAPKILETADFEGNPLKINLDEKLTILENAQKFFEKAANTEKEAENAKKQIPKMQNRLNILNEAFASLDKAENLKELEKIKQELKRIPGINVKTKKSDMEDKFRKFDLGEGFFAYAGKNAANNDELTVKFAKPNDLWFHARGVGGSHVVLRLDKSAPKPPKHILHGAASIAAYYSRARNARHVPVAYTFKKFVRKPKGAAKGSVTMSREEVIMVDPKLPEENI